ncbi:hypothetical protein [Mycoavidus sp. B2-EB]|uniref:hypothetical protein n=1 Tax=Mycoavidus sp. B2-EB TaxID=2651972 RepID=UPI00162854E0|nr:hypothetical protein [Mycoavidus sp. B2-EB]BBO59909.1 hypothetical protein MPB2EB_1039 [Mycoavidus sp. B2-EB]
MKFILGFNKFKEYLAKLLLSHGLTDIDLSASHKKTGFSVWHINWRRDLNKDFKEDWDSLKREINLYDRALLEKDRLAAKAGLMHASIKIGDLAISPFWSISHDLTKILNNKNYNWPSLGLGYAIPKKYLDEKINEIDQKEWNDLAKIQKILIDLVKSQGVTDEELKRVDKRTGRLIWGIDLNVDFNKVFYEKLLALQIAFEGYEKAFIQEDWRAVRAILQRIRLINFQLYKFLKAIRIALRNARTDERFNWPSFPEDYKVPVHYNYKE